MNEPVRVLCVFSTLNRGGAETMCMNLYRNIDRRKVQFDFIKHTSEIGAFETEILSLGGRIYDAPRYKGYNYFSYKQWWKNHLNNHPEHQIIHGHFFTISSIYFKFAQDMGRVTIGHIHASRTDSCIKEYLVKNIEKYATYKFACSQEAGKWAYGNHKFQVINNALSISEYRLDFKVRDAMRKQFKIENNLVLGTVANHSVVKNPYGLLEIFNEIHKRRYGAKLLWVGDGSLKSEIKEKISSMGLEDSVILLGRRNDVPKVLQAMDAFLLPSYSEGLPVSLIEAQAVGLHCFVSDNVTSEANITGLCTYLPLDNSSLWADAILDTNLEKIDYSQSIYQAGYEIKDTASQLQSLYFDMLHKLET